MGKFRSKLKRHTKGKSWSHGHSSTSNPENQKHRIKAKSRFFQPNLSLGKFSSSLKLFYRKKLMFYLILKLQSTQQRKVHSHWKLF